MKISYAKLIWKFMTGGKTAVLDYILDKANTAVAALSSATKEKCKAVVETLNKITALLKRYAWLCPAKYSAAFNQTLTSLQETIDMASDLEITKEELERATALWQQAYAAWCVDDNLLVKLAEEESTNV